jgi:CheY-like chemotaxis protein
MAAIVRRTGVAAGAAVRAALSLPEPCDEGDAIPIAAPAPAARPRAFSTGPHADGVQRLDPLLILRHVTDGLRGEAAGRAVALIAPQPAGGFVIDARPGALGQVLHILLSNAVRHNRPGGAVLTEVRQTHDGLSIQIHDTGPGLEPEALARVFHTAPDDAGRGLSRARRLVRTLGGRLSAASTPGQGSTFTLSLPGGSAVYRRASALPRRDPALARAVLMYVDADPAAVALVRQVTGALGAVLHVCADGEEGLTLARDLRPDLILVEPNLRGMDGFRFRAGLDADPLTRGLPVVALARDPDPALARRGRRAGFSGWLTRPLDIALFSRTLVRLLPRRPDAQAESASTAPF